MKSFKDYIVPPKSNLTHTQISLDELRLSREKILIIGCGENGRHMLDFLSHNGIMVDSFCESPLYHTPNKYFCGKPVYCFNELDSIFFDYNLVLAVSSIQPNELLRDNFAHMKKLYVIDWHEPTIEMSYEWLTANCSDLDHTFNMLEDELSRRTFLSYIDSKGLCIKGNQTPLWQLYTECQYFNTLYDPNLYPPNVLIDCGAFSGDSAEEFLNMVRRQGLTGSVYSFEPDENNYVALQKNASRIGNIECFKYAVGDKNQTLYWTVDDACSAHVSNVQTNLIIESVRLDDILADKEISIIKMDIEGYEVPALLGCQRIITEQLPFLAICVYHKVDDLITIPKLIREYEKNNPNKRYKYYLRQHSCFGVDMVLYAVPTKKDAD